MESPFELPDSIIHQVISFIIIIIVDLGGLGVTFSTGDPRFAGSNPAEVDGFSRDVKILSPSPPEGPLSRGVRV